MGDTHQHYEVLFVSAIFSRHDDALAWATEAMQRTWGPIALTSDAFSFADTEYYTETMGPALRKQFVAFEKPFAPERLVDAKLHTNALELEYGAIGDHTEQRPLNIDPGYLTEAKLVLASTKDRDHRIYLAEGIFAEVTLHFARGNLQSLPWTYPDYQRADYHAFFTACREYLRTRYRTPKHL